jgi:hypothetical protein
LLERQYNSDAAAAVANAPWKSGHSWHVPTSLNITSGGLG